MIVSLRGPNGSGKTTVARSLLAAGVAERWKHNGVDSVVTEEGVCVVGKYGAARSGGMDTVKYQAQGREAVYRAAMEHEHVLFEGVIVSTIYGPWLELSRRIAGDLGAGRGITWAFLDTPLEVCLERVYARNGGKPIKEEQVEHKWKMIQRMRGKADADGEHVVLIPHQTSVEAVRALYGLPEEPPEGFDPADPMPDPEQTALL